MPQLNVVKEGSGPVVVLSHAVGCELGMWDGVAAALKSRFTVLRYDHRNHGRSEIVRGPCTIDMLADDAAALIESQHLGPVHFVGLSLGGMTAQALAARHPHLVRSIVVANSASHYGEAARTMWAARVQTVLTQGMEPIAEGALQRWFTPEFRADVAGGGAARVAAMRAQLVASDPQAYGACCEAVAQIDFRASNPGLACPALVIAGTRDEATPPAMSEAIAAAIPNATLRTLDAAHLSAVEQPAAFAELVSQFIDRL